MMNWFSHRYPYSDLHELNLDWIIDTVSKLEKKVDLNFDEAIDKYIMERFDTLFAGISYVEETHTLKMYLGIVGDGEHVYTPGNETMIIL